VKSVNVAVVCPSDTRIEAGRTVNMLFVAESVTTVPPATAGASSVIVTLTDWPPVTAGLLNATLRTPTARTSRVAVAGVVPAPRLAVKVTTELFVTDVVWIGNVAVV